LQGAPLWPFPRRKDGASKSRQRLSEGLSEVGKTSDPSALAAELTSHVREIAGCQAVLLCGHDRERDAFVSTLTGMGGDRISFDALGRLVQWLETNEDYFPIPDDRGVFAFLEETERGALLAAGARFCMPLLGTEGVVGVLLLVDERAAWQLTDVEARALFAWARHAGLVWEEANQYHAKHERLQTLHRAGQLVVAGQLAAAVAHEVRNPLSTIRSTIQYVVTSPSAWEHKRGLLVETLAEVDRIEEIVSGLLSLSRPEHVSMAMTDVSGLVLEAVNLARHYVEGRSIDLRVDLGPPFVVPCDQRELRQVFLNLLMNACQAMSDGGRLTVTTDVPVMAPVGRDEFTFGAVRIADTGPGIPADQRDRIFDPFYTTKKGGTGLGLPVCLEIVTRHGGQLDLTYPTNGGTVASVFLPLQTA
jgi:signal transduction histidine kinase